MASNSSGSNLFFKRVWFAWSALCFGVLTVILTFPVILCVSLFGEITGGNLAYGILRFWGRLHGAFSGIWVSMEGPYDQGPRPVIFVANHGSYLDAITLIPRVPGTFRPLGKIEMAKIPIFGRMYRRTVIAVDRGSQESRRASVAKLKDLLIRHQISILIFPEGTMNRTPDPLTPFKDGAFRIAAETGIPIVPVAIIGARENMPRRPAFTMRPGHVRLRFGEPIAVQGKTPERLKAEAYEAVAKLLNG